MEHAGNKLFEKKKVTADSTTVVVQTVLEDYLKVSLRSIRYTVERFSGTSKTYGLGTTLLKCWINPYRTNVENRVSS